jgi:alkenylglycerophosphocholine/alkenylglycerophosphoethanolamine hydrolase
MPSRTWLFVSAAASAAYLLTQPWQPFAGPLVKGCAVGALAALAWQSRGARRDAGLLALGLALCTAGDVLLDLNPRLFAFGLGAFLLAHLAYTRLFVRNRTFGIRLDPPHLAVLLLILVYSVTLSVWIVPSVHDLAVPVVVYILALTTMVCAAILARFRQRWVAVGAILFLISDSLLAIHKFKTPVPMRDYLVWTTYYLGQCGIALGYLANVDYAS